LRFGGVTILFIENGGFATAVYAKDCSCYNASYIMCGFIALCITAKRAYNYVLLKLFLITDYVFVFKVAFFIFFNFYLERKIFSY